MIVSTIGKFLITVSLIGAAACGKSDSMHRSADNASDALPSYEEQRLADSDPIHAPYLHLLYAAFNLDSCQRDQEKNVVAVAKARGKAEALAAAKGFEPAMKLTKRIFLIRLSAELHAQCVPNFDGALDNLEQAVQQFEAVVEGLPQRAKN